MDNAELQRALATRVGDVRMPQDSKTSIVLRFAVPSVLISYGIATQFSPALHNFDKRINSYLNQHNHTYSFDEYIWIAPYAAIYGLEVFATPRNSFWNRTVVLGVGGVLTLSAVMITKSATHVQRPNTSDFHSFPSRHAAVAFLGAQVLLREYWHVSPWIGVGAYTLATTTAVMRMVNHHHWLSDVVTGAGVGILSAEIAYQLLPLWNRVCKRCERTKSYSVSPIVSPQQCGVVIVIRK
jgi:membrane-associated phospholipid phosphatase